MKLGVGDGLDAERLCAVRWFTALPLTVDANEAWSFDQAAQVLPLRAEPDASSRCRRAIRVVRPR